MKQKEEKILKIKAPRPVRIVHLVDLLVRGKFSLAAKKKIYETIVELDKTPKPKPSKKKKDKK